MIEPITEFEVWRQARQAQLIKNTVSVLTDRGTIGQCTEQEINGFVAALMCIDLTEISGGDSTHVSPFAKLAANILLNLTDQEFEEIIRK